MELIKRASQAYQTLSHLRESGYTIEEMVTMLSDLGITIEVLKELSKW